MKMTITKKRRRGKKTIPQFDDTKLADTFTMDEARANLFLKQQAMTMINTAKSRDPMAIKIRVALLAIRGWA